MRALFVGALLVGAGCADTSGRTDAGSGTDAPGACASGASQCQGNSWVECVQGQERAQDCGAGVCIEGSGCRKCAPSSDYCVGQDVYRCNDDGTQETKVESCPPGQDCVLGKCTDLCDLERDDHSNVGCEFWAVDLPNEYGCQSMDGGATCFVYTNAASEQFAVAVANTSQFEARIKIAINEAEPGQPLALKEVVEKAIPSGSLGLIPLPMREVDCSEWTKDATGRDRRTNESQSCLTSRAYRIKSNVPVVAYQFNPIVNDFSNGASLLIPTSGIDRDYIVLGWATSNPVTLDFPPDVPIKMEGIPDHTNVTIVGVFENTQVEVKVAHKTMASPDGKIPACNAGDTITAILGPFDVLNINSDQDWEHPTGDLTGTTVTSSNPVVVFSGAARFSVPMSLDSYSPAPPKPPVDKIDVCCTEHLEQQMFPVTSWGKEFAVTRTPVRCSSNPEYDFYRIIASEDGTQVQTNLTNFPTFALNAGQVANFWSATPFTVQSSKPIMVGQYAVADRFLNGWGCGGGDPEFVVFPPVEQHRPEYIMLTPPTFTSDYLVISAPDGAQVRLDGVQVSDEFDPLCVRTSIGQLKGAEYIEYRCPVEDGVHRVEAAQAVGIMAYGYYSVGSYGYPGGADVRRINPIR